MRRALSRASVLVLALGPTVLVGCGDSDTTTPTPGAGASSSSGGVDAGRDGRAFVEEPDGSTTTEPDARKPTDPLRVFVTKDTFAADLDGTNGADTKCAAAAEAASIKPKGKWVAWISTPGGQTVKDNIVTPAGSLPLQLLDGTAIAKKASDLLAPPGLPLHAIDQSESKTKVTGHAWTGTKNLGEPAVTACLAWTNGAADHKGATGDVTAADATWTELATTETCDTKNHLYCFEVP